MLTVMPFLLFDGYCAQAMEFYKSCLGGDLTIVKVSDTPMKEQMPPEQHVKVAYAHLKNDSIEFSAQSWLHPTRTPKQGNTVCMYLTGKTYRELKDVFDKLAVEPTRYSLMICETCRLGSMDISPTSTESTGSSEVRKSQAPEVQGRWSAPSPYRRAGGPHIDFGIRGVLLTPNNRPLPTSG